MTDGWGWVHIQGATVQFSARTCPTSDEARADLQAHLDAHASEAAAALRKLSPCTTSSTAVHLPGHTWRIHASSSEVRIFVGDECRSYRRPSAARAPSPAPAPVKRRRVSLMAESSFLRRIQVFGGLIMLGGVGAAFSSNFEGDRVKTLLFFPLGLALLLIPVFLDLLGLRGKKRQRGE